MNVDTYDNLLWVTGVGQLSGLGAVNWVKVANQFSTKANSVLQSLEHIVKNSTTLTRQQLDNLNQIIIEIRSALSKTGEIVGGAGYLANYPKIRAVLGEIDPILKSAGFDRYRFQNLIRQSDNLKYLEENASLLNEVANKVKAKMQYTDADLLKIFKDAVNTDFVKTLLPNDFVTSLKKFGRLDNNGVLVKFSDEDIFSYFRNYHNVYTKGEFLTQIENILFKKQSI